MIRHEWMAALLSCTVLVMGTASFYGHKSTGATTTETKPPRVVVAPGYTMSTVAAQLTTPVGAAVSPQGEIYIAEAGGTTGTPPRVLRLGNGRSRTTVASDFPAPLTGVAWHEGKLWVSYAGGVDVLDPSSGEHHPVLTRLPAQGDYPNNPVTFGPDGKLYFGMGTATNSGIIGLDNIRTGWVKSAADFHDIPCKPVKLRGSNYTIPNPLTADPLDSATTGAFSAFGRTTARLQTVSGVVPCTGAVLRANPDGTGLEMVAWGLRNPFGVAFGPDRQLYATMQGFEDRGSRPVVNDRDYVYRIEQDRWYGWPDYAGGRSVVDEDLQKPSLPAKPLLAEVPDQPPAPVTTFETGSGAKGLIFPPDAFGLRGDALVALFGAETLIPQDQRPHGYRIVRVNPRSGMVIPFAHNDLPGPASAGGAPGLERPIAFAAAPDGSVYVIDYGQLRPGEARLEPVAGTGALWRIRPMRRPGSAGAGLQWRWALVGLVLSMAGARLATRRPDEA
jgi:glucose/arabinose dehydrogenase